MTAEKESIDNVHGCLFCQQEEKGYKQQEEINYVCSYCTQLLLRAKPENLKRAYEKAKHLNRKELIHFLESYIEEDKDVRDDRLIYKVVERSLDGKRTGRETRLAHD